MKKKVLVVGSGPSSYGALLSLVRQSNLEITVIDNSNLDTVIDSNRDVCVSSKSFGDIARVSKELNIYEDEETHSNETGVKISKLFGGFSNVWGGTFSNIEPEGKKRYASLGINIDEYYKKVEKSIPKISFNSEKENVLNIETEKNVMSLYRKFNSKNYPNSNIEYSSIAINKKAKENIEKNQTCLECGSPNWTCSVNTIWSSANEISDLIKLGKIKYLKESKLLSLKEIQEGVKCFLSIEGVDEDLVFDKVYIGIGPLATSIVMINSSIVNKVEILISEMVSIPFFTFNSKGKKKHSFADLFINQKIEESEYFTQLYFFSRTLLKLAESVLPFTKYIRFFPDRIFNFFGGVFIYIDSQLSNKVVVKKNKEGNIYVESDNSQDINNIRVGLAEVRYKLRQCGIYLIPFLKKNYFKGESNHYGGQFKHSLDPGGCDTDILGRLKMLKNTHIVDSSVLPHINIGPITPTIIANSYRIAEKSINQ